MILPQIAPDRVRLKALEDDRSVTAGGALAGSYAARQGKEEPVMKPLGPFLLSTSDFLMCLMYFSGDT